MLAVLPLALMSCSEKPVAPTPIKEAASVSTNQELFEARGVIKEIKPDGKSAVIKHEAVTRSGTNYMPAMTMPFDVKNTNELSGLKPGDVVSFRMIVAGDDVWIDQVKKLDVAPKTSELPSRNSALRIVRDVEPLNVGDPLPAYHFTNELGKAVSTADFKGKAFAFTFIFTKCPLPNFCPMMSKNFAQVQSNLLSRTDAPKNWQLLSISFDPESDTPETLKNYGSLYKNNTDYWNFATGDLVEITAIADQVGEKFGNEGGSISHNLRTVVVDTQGRVQKIFTGNQWTSDELAAEIIKAAQAKQ
jgi:protein SCO1